MARQRSGYLLKRGGNYYVSWRMDGKLFTRVLRDEQGNSITNRREAEAAKMKEMAPFLAGDQVSALESLSARIGGAKSELARIEDEQNPALTIDKAWITYLKSANRPDTGEATLRQYGFQFGAFVDWMKQHHPTVTTLRGVSEGIVVEYAGHLQRSGLSSGTFNKHLNLLALVFRVLKKDARLMDNPWLEIQRKRIAPHTRRELTLDELRKVCDSATGELRTLLALGVYSGLRLGDCATLRWAEVDLPRNIIRRVPNKTARSRPDKVVHIPIHPTLGGILGEIPNETRSEYVLPETAKLYMDRIDLVTDMVQRHFMACGIKPYKPGTGENGKRAVIEVGFHSLRHTFVSLCRESNAPLAIVESIVGHSNPAMTRHYTHVGELAAGQAVAALPAVFGDNTAAPANRDPEALLRKIRVVVEGLGGQNWQSCKAALIALLDHQPRPERL